MQQRRVRWGRERQASASWHLLPRQQLPQGPPRPTVVQTGAARATWAVATGPGLQFRHSKASGARLPPRLLGGHQCWGCCWVGGRKNMTCGHERWEGKTVALTLLPLLFMPPAPAAPARSAAWPALCRRPAPLTTAVMLSCEPRAYASMHSARAAYSAPAARHLSASCVASSLSTASHSPSLASTSTRLAAGEGRGGGHSGAWWLLACSLWGSIGGRMHSSSRWPAPARRSLQGGFVAEVR